LSLGEEEVKADRKEDLISLIEGQEKDNSYREVL
jgi:hypothetical protein